MIGLLVLVFGCAHAAWACTLLLGSDPEPEQVIVSPTELQFGPVVLNNRSAPITVTVVAKSKTSPLIATIEGSSEFTIGQNTCERRSLKPDEICDFKVVYAPRVVRDAEAAINLSNVRATLEGEGIADQGIDFSPNPVEFGETTIGVPVQAQVTLTNNSSDDLLELEIELIGDTGDFDVDVVGSNCAAELSAGSSCDVPVEFTPKQPKSSSATLVARVEGVIASAVSISGSGRPPDTVTHLLTVTVSGPGTVSSNPLGINCSAALSNCVADFVDGETVTLRGTPIAPFWSGCLPEGTDPAQCDVEMDDDHAVNAGFPAPVDAGPDGTVPL